MAGLSDIGKQLVAVWDGWPATKKTSMVVFFVAGVAAFVILVLWSTATHYSLLMSGLSAEDAAEISALLDGDQVPYRLSAGGSVITVPEDRVHEVRLQLAGARLPRGGATGYELFDDPGLGMSRFAERLNFKRALEGELRRTLKALDPVKDARVLVVLPEKRLFRDKRVGATASVSLVMHPGRALSSEQVQAVVHLVASSVEGLTSDNIAVVDSAGRVLTRGGAGGKAFNAEMEHQEAIERALEARVVEILGRVVGRENITARVTVKLDFTQREQTSESYDPDSVATRSERTSDEQRQAGAAGPGGIPGARTNLAGGAAANVAVGATGSSNKRAVTRNFEVSKETSREMNSTPQISRLSVAVLVNDRLVVSAEVADDAAPQYDARPEQELARLTQLVKNAVGFDPTRGDQLELVSMPFAPEERIEAPAIRWWDILKAVWRPVLALLLFITVVFVLRRLRKAAEDTAVSDSPKTVRELEAAIRAQRDDPDSGAAIEGLEEGSEPMQLGQGPRPEPAKAATVIKGWLAEG